MKCIVPIALLTFAGGCLPATTTLVPEVRGRVVHDGSFPARDVEPCSA